MLASPSNIGVSMSEKPKFKDVLKALDAAVGDTLAYFEGIDPSDLPTLLKSFALLKENKEKLSFLEEMISNLYQNLSYEVIPNAFEANGFDSVKLAGKNFILATRVNASIPEDKREAGHEWLINEAKVPELIKSSVNSKQLSSFVTSYFDTHGCWPPEEVMSVHKQTYIQVRKA